MGRNKFRTRKPFLGRKKKAGKRRIKKQDTVDSDTYWPTCDEPDELTREFSTQGISASSRKLSAFGIEMDLETNDAEMSNSETTNYYFLAQEAALSSLIRDLLCPVCKMPGIVFEVNAKAKIGFAASATLKCENCKKISNEGYLCQRIGQSTSQNVPFDINMRAVLAFRGVGCGYSAMKEWGSIMDMPFIPSQDTYTRMHNKLEKAAKATFKSISQQSRNIIANAHEKVGVHEDDQGILDIAVSFDGTWQKRGHTSHNGVAAVIDLLTGLPIDYEVLSNYCSKCANEEDQTADPEWKAKHAESCSKNCDGSAGSMEVECATRIWKRSISENRLRYTVMLCDGDSKAFDAVSSLNIYGEANKLTKEDCINHVSKRMGTALMNLISESKVQKDSIGGKGKLTQVKIKKIQNYYGRAIKDYSNDIPLLKKRIMAILFHLSSTDDTPKHVHCPPGERSWCFWQRAVAKAEQPPSHKDHETLPLEIGKRLVPIFIRLSDFLYKYLYYYCIIILSAKN